MTTDQTTLSDSVARLTAVYGGPSQAGFGSAVFHESSTPSDDLAALSFTIYRRFVGGLWERFGADAWTGQWKQVHVRAAGAAPGIVAELRAVGDADAARSIPLLLDEISDPEEAQGALAAVYDDPAIDEVRVFTVGDGAAMSGVMLSGRKGSTGAATIVVVLMD